MKLVTRNNLEGWAGTTFSKAALPYLISRLVRATTPASTKANLPSGSATYIGGWDGIVNCETETAYVPQGTSLWEFGTSSDCKGILISHTLIKKYGIHIRQSLKC